MLKRRHSRFVIPHARSSLGVMIVGRNGRSNRARRRRPGIAEEWRQDYNQNRPHSSLGNLTPEKFRTEYTKRLVAAGLSL